MTTQHLAANGSNESVSDGAQYERFAFDNTELRPFHSEETGRNYLLYIGYPDSYKQHPERNYPVVYLTDGYWSFPKVFSLCTALWIDQITPEFIVVAIGYADEVDCNRERMYELSPVPQTDGWMSGFDGRMGGSRSFLNAIKREIIPYVEDRLRADGSFRVLGGNSMGGLFSLFAMYEEPELFQGVISASPTVQWSHMWLFQHADRMRSKALGDDYSGCCRIPTRLFMSVGDGEKPTVIGAVKAFDQMLLGAGYTDFSYLFRILDGERHCTGVAEAYNRGLRFVFQPMMPSPVMPNY